MEREGGEDGLREGEGDIQGDSREMEGEVSVGILDAG